MLKFIIVLLAIYLVIKIIRIIVMPLFRGYSGGGTTSETTQTKKKKYRGEIVEADFKEITDSKEIDREEAEKKS